MKKLFNDIDRFAKTGGAACTCALRRPHAGDPTHELTIFVVADGTFRAIARRKATNVVVFFFAGRKEKAGQDQQPGFQMHGRSIDRIERILTTTNQLCEIFHTSRPMIDSNQLNAVEEISVNRPFCPVTPPDIEFFRPFLALIMIDRPMGIGRSPVA